jgi:BlaI family transcriptional regulator, penicillinase repressor
MSDDDRLPMSDAEREVLKVIWDHGPQTSREVVVVLGKRGQQWSRTTVNTLLQRLEVKGYIRSDRSRAAYRFHAVVSRDDEMHARMSELAGQLCDGKMVPLVLAFAERHRFSQDELARLRRLIQELGANRRKRRP